MLRRPKPTDSEADLLREQEQFLVSGAPSAASVVRRPDKRRGDEGGDPNGEKERSQRDVVTIEDLPDQLPSLTPAPPKKSRFKTSRVTFEDEDAEERLDRHDTHISAVLSRIVERDTSSAPVSLPAVTGMAFPKVFHRSETSNQVPLSLNGGRKSIFAHQIAAQRLKESKKTFFFSYEAAQTPESREKNLASETSMDTDQCDAADFVEMPTVCPRLVSGQGLSGPGSSGETLRIHEENQAKLHAMSESEILEEQKKLLSQLDPGLVEFVRSRKALSPASASKQPEGGLPLENVSRVSDSSSAAVLFQKPEDVEMEAEEEEELPPPPAVTEDDLPVKPQKKWVHMDKLEPEKLEWMRDLPVPRKKGTKKAMQARFDFAGTLIPPAKDLPTHLGLHHHGEEPERAGYSLQELFLLSRSQVIQQRSLALSTLANILSKARAGEYLSLLKGSVMSTLLDAGLLFLLRFALDDSVEGVMSAAVHALKALLVFSEDEECLDCTFSWFRGFSTFPLLPSTQEEEDEEDEGLDESMRETDKEKEERKSDHDVATQDVVKGLLKMKLLPRLRYILEVVRPSPRVVQDALEVLTRIARHSSWSASQVLDCPRLMETVTSNFLPTSWPAASTPHPQSVFGLPLASAMKLLRVVASSGRHACARLLNSLGVGERLSCLLSADPSELLLEPAEAFSISTEAYRLWAVAAAYGQACQLFLELYPALVKTLQSVHQALDPSDPLLPLRLQRILALLCLLTQVTHTAGCHQELQAGMVSSQGEECLPPPLVSWSQVTGLQTPLLGHLKGFLKSLDISNQKESSLTLIPAYLIYLQAYYQQLPKQSCFKPVEALQELEQLASDVLLPLMSHSAVQGLIQNITSSSLVCNTQSSRLDPDTTLSLPGLACSGWRDRPGPVVPSSPFPLLTGLGLLLETITSIHKGLSSKFSGLLLSESVISYLRGCSQATPTLSHTRAWLLRHEHHLLYLLLRLSHRLVPIDPEVAKHAALYHQVALVVLPWLLPGSEYLAHELLSTIIFNKDFIVEGHSGGPEALELEELKLHEEAQRPPFPSLQTVGTLLREACVQLPSIRGCFLTHLAHLESAVLVSREAFLGRNPWIGSHLFPELSGPTLPSDWPFLPLVSLYERTAVSGGGGLAVGELPPGALQAVIHCLQWLLLLEIWRENALKMMPPVAKLARLSCMFLCSSDLFLETPVQKLTWGLFRLLTRRTRLDSLDLNVPPPGLASFQDLYSALLAQYEAVSFGDRLFGCWILLPLQRRYSVAMRLAVFGEHVGMLRSLGVSLEQLCVPVERFTSPPEDSLPLLRLYFRSLVIGTLKRCWCPVLYVVALSHINSFIFSQDAAAQEVEAARHSMLRKIYYLTDEVLRNHLLLFRLPRQHSEFGFDMYEQLPPIRAKRLACVLGQRDGGGDKGD
ncbi:RNA polymerase II-associated protein 1 [Betta splendens]|uniref:RNA polymerase II-associated protein 1 n=1 Tax=Betta splendens TaxID=158456 RepID=A0A6P7LIB8_BETSP|nr:RNA polymerase II-associated protein 1 [Betta splendens]XP_028994446.1 RNA polymerase II-associated protein 1 [Betta splendens]XP_028994447.1 RNA polymerase II-associated protein 1 [Betta splendens]XP_028994448.1 RNA polymerase II-associated protein 1 [Betta splendens]XP_055361573.1 RNA polymerase II-associated protein 1 [Betta splendens]XP_055361574.1 RNA polymerase II-associated protein 1 [Betta splendens]XP_055361575.1 RNA polymerase II-associated protein 1 [Betta splendens]